MNEQQFSELMQHGRLKMPFSDFEDRTMARIQRERQVKAASQRYRKLSWMFFLLGAVLGALATSFVTALQEVRTGPWVLVCQLVYVVVLLGALGYLLRSKPSDYARTVS